MVTKAIMLKLIPYTIFYICCSVIGLILIKTAGQNGLILAGLRLNIKTLFGLLIYLMGFCSYFYLIQNYQLSYVFPFVIGLNYVAVVLSAAWILRETVSVTQWAGIMAIFIGILLMNLKPMGQ
jgi:drug/metabolite transporter (DMT)-like permease